MRALIAAAMVALALPAAATAPAHCHQAPPAAAPETTEAQRKAVEIVARGTHIIPVMFRRYCRVAAEADRAYLLFSLRGTGCGPESDLADRQLEVLTSDPEGLAGYARFAALANDDKAAFCEIAGEMPLPIPELTSRVKWLASHEAYTEAMSQLFGMLSGAGAEGSE